MQSIIKARGLFVNHTFKTSSPSLFVLPSNHVVASPSQQQQQQYIPTTFSSSLLTNTQVRHGGKHLPMSLKGRRGWKKVLEKKKQAQKLSKRTGGERVDDRETDLLQDNLQKKWIPETPVEQLYMKIMKEFKETRKRHSSTPVEEMLDLVDNEVDMQFALRVWRVLSFRNIKFTTNTTYKLVTKFAHIGDLDSAFDVLVNSKVLRMPVGRDALTFMIEQFVAPGDAQRIDQAIQFVEAAANGKFPHFQFTSSDLNKFISALKSVEGDHNERFIKTVGALTKPRGIDTKKRNIQLLAHLPAETKTTLLEACRAVKNDQSALVMKYLQLALLTDAELSSQIEALFAEMEPKEAVAEEGASE